MGPTYCNEGHLKGATHISMQPTATPLSQSNFG